MKISFKNEGIITFSGKQSLNLSQTPTIRNIKESTSGWRNKMKTWIYVTEWTATEMARMEDLTAQKNARFVDTLLHAWCPGTLSHPLDIPWAHQEYHHTVLGNCFGFWGLSWLHPHQKAFLRLEKISVIFDEKYSLKAMGLLWSYVALKLIALGRRKRMPHSLSPPTQQRASAHQAFHVLRHCPGFPGLGFEAVMSTMALLHLRLTPVELTVRKSCMRSTPFWEGHI